MLAPLMPKATAVWLVENTSLTFEQIAEFCGLHPLEVQAIADGEVAVQMQGLDPVANGQTTAEELERCQADPNARLNILAANGSQLRATTWGDTLSVLRRHDGVVLASEPYDDNPDWQEVPDRHLVVAGASRVELIPLKGS